MKSLLFVGALLLAGSAHAAPVQFKNCPSKIVTEEFSSCPGGEGGSATICGTKQTIWGSVETDMSVDSEKKSASATVVYHSASGKIAKSTTKCTLGQDNWMECTTTKPVSELGKLTIAFNIDGIAPDVYFVDIFADATNVPVGGFQTAESACKK